MNDEEIKVSELDSVSEIRDTDQIMIVQGGANKKVLGNYINEHGVKIGSSEPDTSQKVWFKIGKNLFTDKRYIENASISSNGEITNGTYQLYYVPVIAGKTYSMATGTSNRQWVYNFTANTPKVGETGTARIVSSGATETFTVPTGYNFLVLRRTDSGGEVISNLMINEGTSIDTYEAYIPPEIKVNDYSIYKSDEVHGFELYSTTEQVVGKWINGKPVYRKVIDYYPTEIIGAGGTTTNVQVPHNISNFSQIINCRVVTETNHVFPTLASSTGSTLTAGNAIIQVNSTNIIFRIINDSWSSRHFYFILEYTKTTD